MPCHHNLEAYLHAYLSARLRAARPGGDELGTAKSGDHVAADVSAENVGDAGTGWLPSPSPRRRPFRRAHVIKRGKTPVLTTGQARVLIESIDTSTLVGLRNRALIGVMTYAFARIGAVVSMRVEDYFANGKRWWVRLHEKSGKRHEMPAHPQARNGDSPGLLSPAAYRSLYFHKRLCADCVRRHRHIDPRRPA
jgi:integrase